MSSTNITVLGVGNMGQALGKLFADAGHRVTFGARQESKAQEAAAKVGDANVQGTGVAEAIAQGDVVILALPYEGALSIVTEEAKAFAGKIVIDITNPVAANHMTLTIGHTTSAGEEIASRIPEARVIKAFNTIFADILRARAQGEAIEPSVYVAGDDAEAKTLVLSLVAELGFTGVDSGPLLNARYLEPMTELLIQMAYVHGHGTRIGFKFV